MTDRVPGLFITGTNTEVGKSYVTALIAEALTAAGHRVGVYKPAASGCWRDGDTLVSDDATQLWLAAGRPGELDHVCPQRFTAALAPHLAAREEGKELDADLMRSGIDYWQQRSDVILVEGAGGLMSPMGDDEYVADLAYDFGFPLIVVSPNVLGTINATLQTLITAAAFRDGLDVAGVVLNNPFEPSNDDASLTSNRQQLEKRCGCGVLTEVVWEAEQCDTPIDWFKAAKATDR